jgi:hypothetical protein
MAIKGDFTPETMFSTRVDGHHAKRRGIRLDRPPFIKARFFGAPFFSRDAAISLSALAGVGQQCASHHVHAMRGGAQSHIFTTSDGHAYVVKFAKQSTISPRARQ